MKAIAVQPGAGSPGSSTSPFPNQRPWRPSFERFASATDTLAQLPSWVIDDIVTGVYGLEEFERAFSMGPSDDSTDDDTTIKTAVEFACI